MSKKMHVPEMTSPVLETNKFSKHMVDNGVIFSTVRDRSYKQAKKGCKHETFGFALETEVSK